MSALEKYLQDGAAEIMAFSLSQAGEYELVAAWPSADFRWDPLTKVLAWWWAGDERPHAFKIDQVSEDDYAVTFTHAGGKVELGPVWNDEQKKIIDDWSKAPLRAKVGEWLAQAVEETEALSQPSPIVTGEEKPYQIIAELIPVQDVPGQWAVAGAWAADEDEVAFWALPQYAGVGDWAQRVINEGLANGAKPLELLDYWWNNANFTTRMRLKRDSVMASSANAAAEKGARDAEKEAGGTVTLEPAT